METSREFEIGQIVAIDRNHMPYHVRDGLQGKIISGPIIIHPGTVHEDACYAVHLIAEDRLPLSAGGSIGNILVPTRAITRA